MQGLLYTVIAMRRKIIWILIALIFFASLFLRLWHIEFGLPHSFYGDETEIAEPAIKYTYEAKDIIQNNNYYKLIPVSFVYGTFPVYVLTAGTMVFSKTLNIFQIAFDKMSVYIFMRSFTAFLSLIIIFAISLLYYKIYKDKAGGLICFLLLAFNWKLIVHAHYVNQDIFLTILLSLSFLTLYLNTQKNFDHKLTILTGILFGLAVGTKITSLISLPLYLYIFYTKRDLRGMLAFIFMTLGGFMASNPFSIIFFRDFTYRMYGLLFKEAGMVFDSVDSSPFKYASAVGFISTIPVSLFSLYGMFKSFREKGSPFNIFLVGNIMIYLIFYSLQSRRVDRWLLPIVPLIIFYASFGIINLKKVFPKVLYIAVLVLSLGYYLYFPVLLLTQFQRNTPKSEAYLWAKDNIPIKVTPLPYILVYTEQGLDPMNKLVGANVIKINVYVTENAQLMMPENPAQYDYVIISSRPMSNFKRPEVKKGYPLYVSEWENFKKQLNNKDSFELINEFTLPKPNLIQLSDVFIYRNLKVIPKSLASGRMP